MKTQAQTLKTNETQSLLYELWDWLGSSVVFSYFIQLTNRLRQDVILFTKEKSFYNPQQKSKVNMHPNRKIRQTLVFKQNLRAIIFLNFREARSYARSLYKNIRDIFTGTAVKVTIILFLQKEDKQFIKYFLDSEEIPTKTRGLEDFNLYIEDLPRYHQTRKMYITQAIGYAQNDELDKLPELEKEVSLGDYVDVTQQQKRNKSQNNLNQFIIEEENVQKFLHSTTDTCFEPMIVQVDGKLAAAIYFTYPTAKKEESRKVIDQYGEQVRESAVQSLAQVVPQKASQI